MVLNSSCFTEIVSPLGCHEETLDYGPTLQSAVTPQGGYSWVL